MSITSENASFNTFTWVWSKPGCNVGKRRSVNFLQSISLTLCSKFLLLKFIVAWKCVTQHWLNIFKSLCVPQNNLILKMIEENANTENQQSAYPCCCLSQWKKTHWKANECVMWHSGLVPSVKGLLKSRLSLWPGRCRSSRPRPLFCLSEILPFKARIQDFGRGASRVLTPRGGPELNICSK